MNWQDLFLINEVPTNRQQFGEKVILICNEMNINPNWLMGLMYFETARTFSPSIENSIGCVGLIQFCSSARTDLNVSKASLKAMTNVRQLDYVKLYFTHASWKRNLLTKVNNLTDLYLIIFYPIAVGKSDNYVLGSHNGTYTTVYNNNPFFHDGTGQIKVKNVKNALLNWFNRYGYNTGANAPTPAAAATGESDNTLFLLTALGLLLI